MRQIFNLEALSSPGGDFKFLVSQNGPVLGSYIGPVPLQINTPQMLLCVHSCQTVQQQFKIQTAHSSDLMEVRLLNVALLVTVSLLVSLFHVYIQKVSVSTGP